MVLPIINDDKQKILDYIQKKIDEQSILDDIYKNNSELYSLLEKNILKEKNNSIDQQSTTFVRDKGFLDLFSKLYTSISTIEKNTVKNIKNGISNSFINLGQQTVSRYGNNNSILSGKITELIDNRINSLPPLWKGLFEIGSSYLINRKNNTIDSTSSTINIEEFEKINENLLEKFVDNTSENDKDIRNFSSLESEETYKRESIKTQNNIEEYVKGIYDFLTGDSFRKIINNEESNNSLLEDIIKTWFGGKILGGVLNRFKNIKFFGNRWDNIKNLNPFNRIKTTGGIWDKIRNLNPFNKKPPVLSENNFDNTRDKIRNLSPLNKKPPVLSENNFDNTSKNSSLDTSKKSSNKTLIDTTTKNVTSDVEKNVEKNILKDAGKSTAKDLLTKSFSKSLLKKGLFGAGLAAAGTFALDRFKNGDIIGSALEMLSGASAQIPYLGSGTSALLDMILLLKDFTKFDNGIFSLLDGKDGIISSYFSENKEISDKITSSFKEQYIKDRELSTTDKFGNIDSNTTSDDLKYYSGISDIFTRKNDSKQKTEETITERITQYEKNRNDAYEHNITKNSLQNQENNNSGQTVINNFNTTNNNVTSNQSTDSQSISNPIYSTIWIGEGWPMGVR